MAGPNGNPNFPSANRRSHRHSGHHLDTCCHHDVVRAGDHTLRREVRGLLTRAALPVDGRARNVFGPARREHRVAGDVGRLLADLHHTSHDDVVDHRRVEARALDEGVQRLGREVDGMPVLQLPVPPAERCPDRIHDHCVRHGNSLEDSDRPSCVRWIGVCIAARLQPKPEHRLNPQRARSAGRGWKQMERHAWPDGTMEG